MAEITREFDEPYVGVGGVGPTPLTNFSPSVIGVAGVPYLMDMTGGKYKRESFDVVQQRNTNDQRDVLLLPQDVWRQQAQSWHMGMGQSNQDRDNSLPFRYEESFGVDPWSMWQLSLLPKTEPLVGTGGFTGNIWLTTVENYLVVANDGYSYWYDSLSSASASVGSVQVSPGYSIVDIANNGYTFTCLMSDYYIWYVDSPTSTPAKWSNTHYTAKTTFIAWEKDYLFVGEGNVLKTCAKGASAVTVFTHPDPNFRWYSACPGNSCVYVLGRLGGNTYIHRVNIKSDGTGLNPCIVAAQLPDGETGYTIESYLGYVCIGTDKGVRVAQATNDAGDLTYGPVIPTAKPVTCFEGQDRFIWYGNSGMNSAYTGAGTTSPLAFPATCSGLGRMDLSVTTTGPYTPAYANDIAALEVPTAEVMSVVTFLNKRVFAVAGEGVWFQSNDLIEAGWLTQGVMSYGIEDVKTGLYVQAKWEPLVGAISLDISYDSSDYARLATMQIQGSIRSSNISMGGQQFSRLEARYLLQRSEVDPLGAPVMTRWEVRSIPVKGRASRWTLPILNYEETEIDTVKYTRDPLAVLNTLVNLSQSGQLFTLQESGQSYQVHVKEFAWQPEKLSMSGKAWQGTFTMLVEEVS